MTSPFPWMLAALTVAGCAWGAEFKADIEYGQAGGQRLLLDASTPEGQGPFPIVIVVHGGGWGGGDKQKDDQSRDISPLFEPLTRGNFTWFSINYRLAPTNRWPACFEDVQTAVRWVKAHAAEYKGDPQRIALIGHSAGGHLACLAGVSGQGDTRVQAVVGLAAVTDLVEDSTRRGGLSKSLQKLFDRPEQMDETSRKKLQDASPIDHVKPGLPPFLLLQGDADKTVTPDQAISFQQRLKESSVPCELITLTNAQHRITDWDKFDPDYSRKIVSWLETTLGRR